MQHGRLFCAERWSCKIGAFKVYFGAFKVYLAPLLSLFAHNAKMFLYLLGAGSSLGGGVGPLVYKH